MAARVYEVVWAESARHALDEVVTYIAQDSHAAAVEVLEAAIKAAATLATSSERGRVVPETNDPAIREVLVFRYRLMYGVEHQRVVVAALCTGRATLPPDGRGRTPCNSRRPLTAEWSRWRGARR